MDQDLHLAQSVPDLLDHPEHGGPVAYVGLYGHRPAAGKGVGTGEGDGVVTPIARTCDLFLPVKPGIDDITKLRGKKAVKVTVTVIGTLVLGRLLWRSTSGGRPS